jgi:hypothetical protein
MNIGQRMGLSPRERKSIDSDFGAFIGSEHRAILPNWLKTSVNRLRHVVAACLLPICHGVEAAIVTSFT